MEYAEFIAMSKGLRSVQLGLNFHFNDDEFGLVGNNLLQFKLVLYEIAWSRPAYSFRLIVLMTVIMAKIPLTTQLSLIRSTIFSLTWKRSLCIWFSHFSVWFCWSNSRWRSLRGRGRAPSWLSESTLRSSKGKILHSSKFLTFYFSSWNSIVSKRLQ